MVGSWADRSLHEFKWLSSSHPFQGLRQPDSEPSASPHRVVARANGLVKGPTGVLLNKPSGEAQLLSRTRLG